METCEKCGAEVHGSLDVLPTVNLAGVSVISIQRSPDADFIICDLCNVQVCLACCDRPDLGYCNDCLARMHTDGDCDCPLCVAYGDV